MIYNRIPIAFNGLNKVTGPTISYQYDVRTVLVFEDLDLPQYYEVDICNDGDPSTVTMVGTSDGVLIPNAFLRTGKRVKVYIVVQGTDQGAVETRKELTLPVQVRPAREDIDPTEPEQQQIDELVELLNNAVIMAIPTGGDEGQVLAKKSNDDYDTEWVDQTGGGGGGTIVVVPTVTDTNPVYDGTQKSPTITRDTEHTTITGTYEATLPGNYTFTIFLSGVNDVWTDNTTAPKVYAWSVAVPDGSAITPINDIQTWLLCGGIVDKAYTTLNEVLADRDTLVKLMASDNAADYLVRSTSWVSGITANETAMGAIGASDYCSETLLSDSTWCAAIVASAYRSSVLNTEVPTMTSNTTPSGVASASSQSSTGYPWKAFDAEWSDGWGTASTTTDSWLCYDFGKKVKGFVALVNSYASVAVKYVIEGSNDATTWTALTSEITGYVLDRTVKTSLFTQNVDEYRYYRFRCTGGGSGNLGGINMQIYGRNPGGVQTWLKAGSITDKNYITLLEVLADSTTLAALMLDSDAVDYLVTATSWASTITANQTAMTDIGVDDYCADTLLDDSTWRTAICNSTYFESVLNVKVPVMASNTTPSGVCSASNSNSSNEPWKAFDSSDSTAWTAAQNTSSGDSWLQYTFSNNIKAYKLYIKCSLGGSFDGVVAPRFQYYDNTTSAWVNLFTDIIRGNDTRIFQPCVSDKYRFIEARHVWIGDHSTYYSSYVYVIQIYGRASS